MPTFLVLVALLGVPGSAAAQAVDSASDPPARNPADVAAGTMLLATAGAAAGLVAGAYAGDLFYDVTGCCGGGDDPGLISVVLGAATGSVLGSALGAYLGSRHYGIGPGKPLVAALGAVAPAVAAGYLVGKAVDSGSGVLVGVTIGQGAFTTLFTLQSQNR